MSFSLDHLDPMLRSLAEMDAASRIRMISKDLFIEHEYSQYLNDVLDALMCEPRHGRMPCWLIAGDAGMGKTAQLHRFARRHPDHRDRAAVLLRPIVVANVPPEPTRATLEVAILEVLDAPAITHSRLVDRAAVIRRLLTAHQTRILMLDEIQHVCHSRVRDRCVVLDSIKAFSTTCQINVVCAGTPSVIREFQADAQLERRFSVTQFVQWRPGPALHRFLETYERARPLRLPSRLADPQIVRTVLAESGGIAMKGQVLPVCPAPYRDELISSWIERIGLFYGVNYETVMGVLFAAQRRALCPAESDCDTDSHTRQVLSEWTGWPLASIPPLLNQHDEDTMPVCVPASAIARRVGTRMSRGDLNHTSDRIGPGGQ